MSALTPLLRPLCDALLDTEFANDMEQLPRGSEPYQCCLDLIHDQLFVSKNLQQFMAVSCSAAR